MKLTLRISVFAALVGILAFSCKPDPVDPDPVDPIPNPTPGPVIPTGNAIGISFENFVGLDSMLCDDVVRYQNLNGDSFSVEKFKYYISNVSFTDNLGNTWYENESYHLISATDTSSLVIYIDSMPAGTYTSMNFLIGVDSTRNVSGAQVGALDPANGMFWTWNSGYIMAQYEGHSPSSTASFGLVIFHIAGFSGQYAGIRWASPSFGAATAIVTTTDVPLIHMKVDLNEWFQSPNVVDFSSTNIENVANPITDMIADNYVDMFTVRGIDN